MRDPLRFRKKPVVVEAMQFETNNEADDENMHELVGWVNRGKSTMQAWHNGTDIFIHTLDEGRSKRLDNQRCEGRVLSMQA